MTELLQNAAAIVAAAVLTTASGGVLAWLYKSYSRFCSMDNSLSSIKTTMVRAVAKIDEHDEKLQAHGLQLAEMKGRLAQSPDR